MTEEKEKTVVPKRPVKKKKRVKKETVAAKKKARPSKKKREAKKKDSASNDATEETTPMLIAENKINKSLAESEKVEKKTTKKTKKRKRQSTGEFVVVWTLPNEFVPAKGDCYKMFASEKKDKLKKQFLDETRHLKIAGENIRLNGSKRDVARGVALKTHGGLLQSQLLVETRVVKRKSDDSKVVTRTVIVSREKSQNARTSINSVYLKLWRKLIRRHMKKMNIPFFIPSKKSVDPKKKKLYEIIIVEYSEQKKIIKMFLKETKKEEQTIKNAIEYYNKNEKSLVKMEMTPKRKEVPLKIGEIAKLGTIKKKKKNTTKKTKTKKTGKSTSAEKTTTPTTPKGTEAVKVT